MHKFIVCAVALAAALVLGACNNIAKFDYNGAPGTLARFAEPGSAKKTVAVMPFMDQRGAKYFDPEQADLAHGVSFERSLRMIGANMKVKDCLDTSHLNNQVPHRWSGN